MCSSGVSRLPNHFLQFLLRQGDELLRSAGPSGKGKGSSNNADNDIAIHPREASPLGVFAPRRASCVCVYVYMCVCIRARGLACLCSRASDDAGACFGSRREAVLTHLDQMPPFTINVITSMSQSGTRCVFLCSQLGRAPVDSTRDALIQKTRSSQCRELFHPRSRSERIVQTTHTLACRPNRTRNFQHQVRAQT